MATAVTKSEGVRPPAKVQEQKQQADKELAADDYRYVRVEKELPKHPAITSGTHGIGKYESMGYKVCGEDPHGNPGMVLMRCPKALVEEREKQERDRANRKLDSKVINNPYNEGQIEDVGKSNIADMLPGEDEIKRYESGLEKVLGENPAFDKSLEAVASAMKDSDD